MATRPEDGDDSVVATARRVVADTSLLLRSEAALARLETEANARALASVAARFGAGLGLVVIALLFLLSAGLVLLATAVGWVPALLGLALLLGAGGLLLLRSGQRDARGLQLLPERSLARLAADLRALSAAARPAAPPDAGPGA